jgi:uncharacterized protein
MEPPINPPPEKPDRIWEIFCHLSAIAGFLIPFGNIVGPLVIWLIKKNENPAVDAHGKESLNFQISMTIYTLLAGLTIFILIGFILVPILVVLNIVLVVMAAIKASNGEFYRYPITIRLVT